MGVTYAACGWVEKYLSTAQSVALYHISKHCNFFALVEVLIYVINSFWESRTTEVIDGSYNDDDGRTTDEKDKREVQAKALI